MGGWVRWKEEGECQMHVLQVTAVRKVEVRMQPTHSPHTRRVAPIPVDVVMPGHRRGSDATRRYREWTKEEGEWTRAERGMGQVEGRGRVDEAYLFSCVVPPLLLPFGLVFCCIFLSK